MGNETTNPFSRYQMLILFGLSGLLFSVVLDFMLLPALSSVLMDTFSLTTSEFGLVASAYAFSAGVSALVSSGYADLFDRKKYLLFYSTGFMMGVVFCLLSQSFEQLFLARIITGIFGGVIASGCYAIITDLFEPGQRGRAMGLIQVAFALALVGGLPLTLYLTSIFSWVSGFMLVLSLALLFSLLLWQVLHPLKQHLTSASNTKAVTQIIKTAVDKRHWFAFSNNISIVLADVLFMTFFAAYCIKNLQVSDDQLPVLYGIGGISTLLFSPLIGLFTDRLGKLFLFIMGTLITIVGVIIYTHVETIAFWQLGFLHAFLFIGISARMITSTAVATMIPLQEKRGSFLALDASLQQLAAGLAAVISGWIVVESLDGPLEHFDKLGWLVVALMLLSILLMRTLDKLSRQKESKRPLL